MTELADTSAWVWSRKPARGELRHEFDTALVDGKIATCDMVRLELLYSARNTEDFTQLREDLEALADCPVGPAEWKRALWVYERLAAQGAMHQRAVKHPDLLIAAAAEAAGAAVLHYDQDYDRIAAITGQPTIWIAPRGTL
ncbi:Ribonuclease VapC51 [Paraconexibacter sp. AEG42_29]|uniref:Ribonuclease VapC n=1 Tax=Paraconexibacter sp. AEG42_29 TaxID=2997339 RepID=A0AAU7APV0_9ACTN